MQISKHIHAPSAAARIGMVLSLVCSVAAAVRAEPPSSAETPKLTRVYISSYTAQGHDGIYLAELNPATGELKLHGLAIAAKKVSFLALHPNHRYLYASCEVDGYSDSKDGVVSAFEIDPASGKLTLMNHQSSGGAGPHHLSLDRDGNYALVANYFGGSVAVLPIGADGKLRPATCIVEHHGSSVNQKRQESPHPHAIDVDPTNHFAFVPDLGLDKVFSYRLDPAAGKLTPNEPPFVAFTPGSGPRHIAFHPNGNWAYVINELNSTVTTLRYDSKAGVLTRIGDVSTLPAGATVENLDGEIMVYPNGKFLYASNRGHDSIAVFAIDQTTGRLSLTGHYAAGGRAPRNFNIDPSGRFLLSANLDSDTVTVLQIDPATGKLSLTAQSIKVPQPYCIEFLP